ncbi:MAG: hypothetical protein IKN27_05560, partial [Selenomonadaceae bacterium]|nr:hypothetical protein [Selenomonadaceae bacterium]
DRYANQVFDQLISYVTNTFQGVQQAQAGLESARQVLQQAKLSMNQQAAQQAYVQNYNAQQQAYAQQQQYDQNQQYNPQQQQQLYDPNQQGYNQQQYDQNQQYNQNPQQLYDPNQQYNPEQR